MEKDPDDSFAHAQNDLRLHILRMFEGAFSLDAAHIRLDLEGSG